MHIQAKACDLLVHDLNNTKALNVQRCKTMNNWLYAAFTIIAFAGNSILHKAASLKRCSNC